MIQHGPDPRIESAIDTAQATAVAAIESVRKSLRNAGPESHAALNAVASVAASLPSTAGNVREYLDKLKADESVPRDYRDKMAAQIHKAAEDRLQEDHAALVKQLAALEHTLGENTLPQPNKDASAEGLVRQEVMNLVSGTPGPALLSRMFDNLGKNPGWDSTMLGDFGQSLFAQAGLTQHDWQQFRAAAVAKLLPSTTGTEKQLANRQALAALHQNKVRGHVTGLLQIAKHRLGDL